METAQDLIEKAVGKAPENAVLNYHLGMVLYKNGRFLEAAEKLEKSLASEESFIGRSEAEMTFNELRESVKEG